MAAKYDSGITPKRRCVLVGPHIAKPAKTAIMAAFSAAVRECIHTKPVSNMGTQHNE